MKIEHEPLHLMQRLGMVKRERAIGFRLLECYSMLCDHLFFIPFLEIGFVWENRSCFHRFSLLQLCYDRYISAYS